MQKTEIYKTKTLKKRKEKTKMADEIFGEVWHKNGGPGAPDLFEPQETASVGRTRETGLTWTKLQAVVLGWFSSKKMELSPKEQGIVLDDNIVRSFWNENLNKVTSDEKIKAYLNENSTDLKNLVGGSIVDHNEGSDIWDHEPTELDDKRVQAAGREQGRYREGVIKGILEWGKDKKPPVTREQAAGFFNVKGFKSFADFGTALDNSGRTLNNHLDRFGDGHLETVRATIGNEGSGSNDSKPVVGSVTAPEVKEEKETLHPNAHKTSEKDVKGVFKFLGLGEPNQDRLDRIVGEINSGKRTLTDVRNDLMQWQAKEAGTSIEEVAGGHIKRIFEEEGLSIATAKETEEQRVERLVGEVLEGHTAGSYGMDAGRSFADIRNSLQEYKENKGGVVHPVEDDSGMVVTQPGSESEEDEEEQPAGFGGVGGGDTDVVTPVVVEPTTEDKVRAIFKSLGINTSDARVKELAGEVDDGRSLDNVKQGLVSWQKKQEKMAGIKDEINAVFKSLGLPAPDETRLDRLSKEVYGGGDGRSVAEIKQDLVAWQKNEERKAAAASVTTGTGLDGTNSALVAGAPKPQGGGGGNVNLL